MGILYIIQQGRKKLKERDMIIVFGSVEKLGQFEKELQSTR